MRQGGSGEQRETEEAAESIREKLEGGEERGDGGWSALTPAPAAGPDPFPLSHLFTLHCSGEKSTAAVNIRFPLQCS